MDGSGKTFIEFSQNQKIEISKNVKVFGSTLRGYHTLQGDNSLQSVERFDHMMFVCRFQASQ